MTNTPISIDTLGKDSMVKQLMLPLQAFFKLGVTEMVINRPGEVITESDNGWEIHEVPELTLLHLRQLAQSIATFTDQKISASHPILSATLPGQERVQIVVEPAVPPDCISFTIRRPQLKVIPMSAYIDGGYFDDTFWSQPDGNLNKLDPKAQKLIKLLESKNYPEFLKASVENHLNVAVVGDTGSGKTTFMKSLCQYIPSWERVITIEDVRELFMEDKKNQVNLLYSKGGQGKANITPADLIGSNMRMKPDRVLLAELRGSESYDFLKLLTTGHSGSLTSFHAESCSLSIPRFVFMAKEHQEAAAYTQAEIAKLFLMTIDVVAHVQVKFIFKGDQLIGKKRVMTEIHFDPFKKRELAFGH